MSENTIDILKLAAIVIASIFGIAGTATETRKKETGKLSWWGYIALIGVIITNSFQFVQTYLEQKQEAAKKIENLRQAARESQDANKKFEKQLALLNSNIRKTDSSLDQQREIQGSTKLALTGIQNGLGLQRHSLGQSKLLTIEQEKAVRDIEKTLTPLIPFKINVYFKIKADSIKDKNLSRVSQEFQQQINSYSSGFNNGTYLTLYDDYAPPRYDITPESPFFEKFAECFHTNPDLGIDFDKKDNKGLHVISKFFVKEKLSESFSIKFNDNEYTIGLFNIPCPVWSNDGFKSTLDLEKTKFRVNFNNWFEKMIIERVEFKFPPDFSTIKEIDFGKPFGIKRFKKVFDHLNVFEAECADFTDTYEHKDLSNLQ